jgi:hypothetical protein
VRSFASTRNFLHHHAKRGNNQYGELSAFSDQLSALIRKAVGDTIVVQENHRRGDQPFFVIPARSAGIQI